MRPREPRDLRRVLGVAVASSCLVILDGQGVGLALPAVERELGGGLVLQQWVMDGYLLTLGALLLAAGAVADRFGTERVLAAGTLWFTLTSLVCGLAPEGWVLVAGRLAQGAAGAVITPSALALITAAAHGTTRLRLIAQWTAWISAASVAAPFVGGAAVDLGSWRLVFLVNVLPAALMWRPLARLRRGAIRPPRRAAPFDVASAALSVGGLGALVLGLIVAAGTGFADPAVIVSLVGGAVLVAVFLVRQRSSADPQIPLGLFREPAFSAGNAATFWAYGALGLGSFIVGLYLQQRMGMSAFLAGLGMLPSTVPMLFLSGRSARLAAKRGPRLPMSVGPAVAAVGFVWLALAQPPLVYLRDVFGPMVLLGIGLALMVAPLTTTVLSAVPAGAEGAGSAVNNAVARIASLVAIGASGAIVGGTLDDAGFGRAAAVTAVLLALAAATSAVWIPAGSTTAEPASREA
ncbi:MFS transporter [Sinomonas sp. R1AF57]|uniref:MFS transporter n=1 Tax=Sinomonas sp. R1AF57 TaxID=2020377 RepID=UPI001ABF65AB|nr:MFS transporter [Sinomonas sp. R1AF57]